MEAGGRAAGGTDAMGDTGWLADRQANRRTGSPAHGQTGRHRRRRQTDKQTHLQTVQVDSYPDGQSGRPPGRPTSPRQDIARGAAT